MGPRTVFPLEAPGEKPFPGPLQLLEASCIPRPGPFLVSLQPLLPSPRLSPPLLSLPLL